MFAHKFLEEKKYFVSNVKKDLGAFSPKKMKIIIGLYLNRGIIKRIEVK
jgi:hypothetical protein